MGHLRLLQFGEKKLYPAMLRDNLNFHKLCNNYTDTCIAFYIVDKGGILPTKWPQTPEVDKATWVILGFGDM